MGRLLVSVTRKVKRTASQIVHPLTQLEKWLKEATSNTNWGCSSTILNEIARSMTDYHDYVVVQKCIGECLSEKPSKWRRIFKTLVLVEYLLKNGIDRFVDDIKEYIYKVRHLQDFYCTEEGKDRGAGIREKSKYILGLLNDPIMLKTERKKARDNRGKYIGINGRTGALAAGCGGGSFGKSPTTSPPTSFSAHGGGYGGDRARSLYDPYCLDYNSGRNDSKMQSSATSRSGSSRIRDGLEEVKSAGILGGTTTGSGSGPGTRSLMDVQPVRLPGPPNYAGTYGGGPDESILNAVQRLARGGVEERGSDLQSADWGTFVAAEDEEERSHQHGAGGDRVSASSLSNNPFELGGFKTETRSEEIERRIMEESMGDLLELGKEAATRAGAGQIIQKREEEFDLFRHQEKNGGSVARHIPYGF